jgi:hypothetical protein
MVRPLDLWICGVSAKCHVTKNSPDARTPPKISICWVQFTGVILKNALKNTFNYRITPLPNSILRLIPLLDQSEKSASDADSVSPKKC